MAMGVVMEAGRERVKDDAGSLWGAVQLAAGALLDDVEEHRLDTNPVVGGVDVMIELEDGERLVLVEFQEGGDATVRGDDEPVLVGNVPLGFVPVQENVGNGHHV